MWNLFSVLLAVGLLTTLIAWGKVSPLLAFVVAALVAALMLGMPLAQIPGAIEKGIGDLLGSLVVVICLGAVFGKLIADSGAARRIAISLIDRLGPGRMPIAMTVTGFVVGLPLYYNVGFVLMIPLIFSLVYQSGRPAVALGMPLLAGLSIAHGFLPPHPSPVALVAAVHADLGKTLLYGLIVAIPTLIIAGPIFSMTLKNIRAEPAAIFRSEPKPDHELPGTFASFFTALLPVVLLGALTAITLVRPELAKPLAFLSSPLVVMLLSYGVAIVLLGTSRGQSLPQVMGSAQEALREIAPILLIIAGAGGLKQVLTVSGVSAELGAQLAHLPVHPLVLGWAVATLIRVCLGSATVAGVTAAGVVGPLAETSGVDPNLMVLAVGAGSLMFSHVNDSGFWMFKEYFGLTLKDTFRSWSLMETLVGSFGILFVLLLSLFIK
ncbi:Gnt-I system high-affinity gluconate transporter [Pseudoduganella lurida]|uniref:Gnt-I system high-affinity gluconate transporter n=1 Tax=Pseudoduganella lurida TaxID=1036180 RepID=A0A562RLC3_9BURK|nr:gluconate:H+ symporter [Pseudoduganella lurida]TWI69831.1 Gnt-I system high-affinity gluconate transporter [Pseudoduganella lurida]